METDILTAENGEREQKDRARSNRMPADSAFYDKILPVLLVMLALFTLILILAAAALLLGIIP